MKAFIIQLEMVPDSVKSAAIALATSLANGYDAKLFAAYTGITGKMYLEALGLCQNPNIAKQHNAGAVGCFASHHALWVKCVELDEPIIILEHDAVALRPWPTPTWNDVLHLDCNGSLYRRSEQYRYKFVNDRRNPVVENSVYNMGFIPHEWGFPTMSCNYAYAITPAAAQKLIDETRTNGYFFADRIIREPVVNIDTIHPPVFEEQPHAIYFSTTTRPPVL